MKPHQMKRNDRWTTGSRRLRVTRSRMERRMRMRMERRMRTRTERTRMERRMRGRKCRRWEGMGMGMAMGSTCLRWRRCRGTRQLHVLNAGLGRATAWLLNLLPP